MKEHLKKIAEETVSMVENGHYKTPSGKVVPLPITDSVLWRIVPVTQSGKSKMEISVTNESTMMAAQRLAGENVCILNFASASHPGGGFLHGAVAQEEALARASNLYHHIKEFPEFYDQSKRVPGIYEDHVIYSPKVIFFRDDHGNLLEDPYTVAVVTAAAPNMNVVKTLEGDQEQKSYDAFYRRIEKVLNVMHKEGHKTIVLGAWGCGAFGNDPYMISDFFADILEANPVFDKVVFAIYDKPSSATYQAFDTTFNESKGPVIRVDEIYTSEHSVGSDVVLSNSAKIR